MDGLIRKNLLHLENRLRRLEQSPALAVVRPVAGGGAGGGATIEVSTASELPALPTTGISFVQLTGDTVYWAVEGNTDWAPLGGRFGLTDGAVGSSPA